METFRTIISLGIYVFIYQFIKSVYHIYKSDLPKDKRINLNENWISKYFDFKEDNYYSFKLDFSFKYAEPMAITLFKDEYNITHFAINCTDSIKYKVGTIYNIEYLDDYKVRFRWRYYRYDGYLDDVRVEINFYKEASLVRVIFHIYDKGNYRTSYVGMQINVVIKTFLHPH